MNTKLFAISAIAMMVFVIPSTSRLHNSGVFLKYDELTVTTNNESTVIVEVTDKTSWIPLDTNHIVVEYKSAFHGWYLPISDVSSSREYFYVVENKYNQSWTVVIQFKQNVSNHLKIVVFPSDGDTGTIVASWIGKHVCELSLTIKKLIAGLFHKAEPKLY